MAGLRIARTEAEVNDGASGTEARTHIVAASPGSVPRWLGVDSLVRGREKVLYSTLELSDVASSRRTGAHLFLWRSPDA